MKLTNFIFESNDILAKIQKIAAYQDFSVQQKAEYIYNICKLNFTLLGEGSNRTVFDIGNGKAIKVSFSESVTYDISSSISQTQAESKICKTAQKAQLIPEIYDVGPEFLYLIVEKVQNLNESDKEKIASYFKFSSFDEFTRALRIVSKNEITSSKEEIEEIKTHRDFLIAVTVMKNCGYAISDMASPQNWGLDPQGKPVMLDTGLTTENRSEILSKQTEKIQAYNKNIPDQGATKKIEPATRPSNNDRQNVTQNYKQRNKQTV